MQKENLVSEDEVFEDILSESEKSESENALNISSNLAEDKDKIEDIKDTETSRLPLNQKIKNFFETYLIAYKSLKTSKISLIWAFISLSIIFFTLAFISFNQRFLISVPTYGGNINEGVIGTARFINPVLAYSQVDKDLIALIYSGLTKKDINGNLILNLADSIEMSPDGLHYNVKIKENAKFQDETNLTSDDVIYTINMIQDQNINSPLAINFEGVSVTKVNDKELIFNLKKPYIYFKDNLSFGILPKHVWQNLTDEEFSLSDYNLNPIGSGPYKISSTVKNSGITQEFHLVSFKNYALGRPFIDDINIFIYPNQKSQADSLNAGTVSRINTLSKEEASSTLENKNVYLATSSLPNLYSLSLNPNKNILLSDKNIRLALAAAIDKNLIVNNIFNSTTEIADSNLPFYRTSSSSEESVNNIYPDLSLAKTYLAKYTQSKATKVVKKTSSTTTISTSTNPVSMTSVAIKNTDISINKSLGIINISTVDTNELKSVANIIKENWEALGFTVNIKVYELSDLSGNVIKNRDFDVLLFGSIVKKDTDLFAYWSSTQRNYPGLNITGYVSKNLDKDLDVLRNSQDLDQRQISLDDINTELNDEMPSIPLYTKLFTYYINDDYQDTTLIPKYMSSNEDRFANIESWYIYKEEIWSKAYFKNIIEKLENIIH
jgi:peptide/nickel transport system substrate-binding protein